MTEAPPPPSDSPLRVVIAGGGVAALEAAFALRALAGERVSICLLSPSDEYVDRPRTVGEPFNHGHAAHYPLAPLVAAAGAQRVAAGLAAVDVERRVVRTTDDGELPYDALMIATGAIMVPAFPHATTINDAHMDELLHGLVLDIEEGYVKRLAVVVPAPMPWPLPAYELALMASERAWDMQTGSRIYVFTPERAPLEIFGETASAGLAALLAERGVEVITSAVSEVPSARTVIAHPSGRTVEVDRVIAMPGLRGPQIPGLPGDGGGFLPIDRVGRVRGVDRVWAAGDVTDFSLKQGGVAAALADVVAQGIAALAGVPITAEPFAPSLRAIVLTGGRPRYLSGAPAWPGADDRSTFSEEPLDASEDKVAARFLTPHLHALDADA